MSGSAISSGYWEKLRKMTGISRPIKLVESNEITSPCVFGVKNCTIILPKELLSSADSSMFHILVHEFAHIKHNDLAVCWLMLLICAVHWFNPVVWYCSKLIRRDQELCADAYAMSLMKDREDYIKYGQTLLSMIKNGKSQSSPLITAGISESKNVMKKRIKSIATFSKNKYRFSLTGLLAIMTAGLFLCTSGIDYPGTAEERMRFDDNILMGLTFNEESHFRNTELQIINNNNIDIYHCQLEIYNANPYETGSGPIYEKKYFRVKEKKALEVNLVDIDYNNAYVKFGYKVGFPPGDRSNMIWREGNLTAFDDTISENGWEKVTEEEVISFIAENNINVTAIKKIYNNLYTIVSFENGNWQGYYGLWKDSGTNKLVSLRMDGYSVSNNRHPVQLLGGTASGNFPFIQFRINSPVF